MIIVHEPFGQEHPYDQLPEERFPRQPLAGETFRVGIVTRPPGAVSGVRVLSSVDDVPQPAVRAEHLADWQPESEIGMGAELLERVVRIDQDVWQATLTAPEHGQTLIYWAVADSDGKPIETQPFTLRGEAWEPGGGFHVDGDSLTVRRDLGAGAQAMPGMPAIEEIAWLTDGTKARQVRVTFRCGPDERFFGLGERFNALDQRGNIMDIRCYEQYKNQGKRTYIPVPFLLASSGYGVHVESSRWMEFDLAASDPQRWSVVADLGDDETLSMTWFTDADPLKIIGRFAQSTGPVVLPPRWSFGLWMSSNEWDSQARVMQEARTSFELGIEPSVLVIEAWSDENTFYIWNDAQYAPRPGGEPFRYDDFTFPAEGRWPDPKGMIDWLHDRDVKLVLWQIPVMKVPEEPHPQQEADRAHFEAAGFGVHDPDGSLHRVRPFWFRGGYIWDVTNPAERDWWFGKRAYLLDEMGVDGFKTDGGEHMWSTQTQFADGRSGSEVWNEYARLYSEAYYNFANSKRESVMFSRSGFVGSQRSPLHWAGDENSTWEAYQHSIYAGLSAGISGIPFWGWDIGGFSGEIPDAELYLRATAMATFCPVMQYHSAPNPAREVNMDRTPWNIEARTGDDRVVAAFRHFAEVRQNLLDYIWREAQHCAATGEPMMRALRLWYPQAGEFQYFFGRDLLVCPVVEPGVKQQTVFIPDGEWTDFWTGDSVRGGQEVVVETPIDRIPVFVRAGAEPVIRR